METEEIYDILMGLLLRAAAKYDPFYSDKVGQVVELLNRKKAEKTGRSCRPRAVFVIPADHTQKDFTLDELHTHLDFDGARFVRILCRHGFLEPAPAPADGVRRYQRSAHWPPPAAYLAAGQIGFTYYLQNWFRYYLQQPIESAMSELEVKEGVYSLDFHRAVQDRGGDGHVANAMGSVMARSVERGSTDD